MKKLNNNFQQRREWVFTPPQKITTPKNLKENNFHFPHLPSFFT